MIPAILCGAALGAGLALALSWWQARRLTLAMRLAPSMPASRVLRVPMLSAASAPLLERLLAPVVRDAVHALERWGTSTAEIERRVRRAGWTTSPDQFRAGQVVWGALGLAVGLAASILLAASRGAAPAVLLILTLAAGAAGVVLRERALAVAVARREQRMLDELPAIAELLALSVSAGEGATGAMERVSRLAEGDLSQEIREVLARTRAGMPLAESLRVLAGATGLQAVRRFADTIATAVERGTPLADVLRAQAVDVREARRQSLMEDGGRREILMMIPAVNR
ncbi:type II secretion system F family protein [Demequina capsici]|uniref:Type II secretion system F family protein n=1 Tax=Demequina capsici TaxID=3075620 RepID=A0AA96FEJ9_9MICO|nr:type II secretion system F family protein [Demequina sp. PMTSA13]WNM28084.1 type II secretion system F family protein [Demequina sp. PMTSA13]